MPGAPPTMLSYRDVPVIVNSFNRVGSLRRLVDWLLRGGYHRIAVVDNASTFPPLLRYLDQLDRSATATVVRLEENAGHTALWKLGLLGTLGVDTEFVYTDPDVVPAAGCPADVVRVLQELLAGAPEVFKAGLGLRLDDLPRRYRHRRAVLGWETKNWLSPAAPGCFVAPIDTTFALYRPGSGHGVDELALRTGPPLVAAHESWYSTGWPLTREARFYVRAAATTPTATWSRLHLPAWLRPWEADYPGRYPTVLLVGTGDQRIPGYLPVAKARRGTRLTLADASVDGVYLPDGLGVVAEHTVPVDELERVAKAGALLVLHQPWPPPAVAGVDVHALVEWLELAVAHNRPGADGQAASFPGWGGRWDLERLQLVNDASGTGDIVHVVAHLRLGSPSVPTTPPVVEVTASRFDLHARFERV